MTTHSSGVFTLSTNIAGICKNNYKVKSKILNCNLTEVAIQAVVWSKVLSFFDLVPPHLYLFRLGDGENLAEIKHFQNMNANISRMSQYSHDYRNGIAEKNYYHYG